MFKLHFATVFVAMDLLKEITSGQTIIIDRLKWVTKSAMPNGPPKRAMFDYGNLGRDLCSGVIALICVCSARDFSVGLQFSGSAGKPKMSRYFSRRTSAQFSNCFIALLNVKT